MNTLDNTEEIVAGKRDVEKTGILRRILEGNYFYAFSAVAMMIGCYLLMKEPHVDLEDFQATLRSLLILQGYEIIVIATIALVARRIQSLQDALSLFCIEIVLLLDPTFFSNALLTFSEIKTPTGFSEGFWVNAICLLVVPIKLILLQQLLPIGISFRWWTAMLAAAAFSYLGGWPMTWFDLNWSLYDTCFINGWLVVLIAATLPAARDCLNWRGARARPATFFKIRWLVGLVPVGTVAAHYLEMFQVYLADFLPLYLVPVGVAALCVYLKNVDLRKVSHVHQLLLDFSVILMLVLTLGRINNVDTDQIEKSILAPAWLITGPAPMVMTLFASMGLYAYFFKKTCRIGALIRMTGLGFVALIAAAVKTGIPSTIYSTLVNTVHHLLRVFVRINDKIEFAFGQASEWVFETVKSHPGFFLVLGFLLLVLIAYRFRSFYTWLAAGLAGIFLLFYLSPLNAADWIPEILQAVFLLVLLLYHRFGGKDIDRYTAASVVLSAAICRFWMDPVLWAAAVVVIECTAALVAGRYFRKPGYSWIGVAFASLYGITLLARLASRIGTGWTVIGCGLALFLIGFLVSFWKEKLLGYTKPGN